MGDMKGRPDPSDYAPGAYASTGTIMPGGEYVVITVDGWVKMLDGSHTLVRHEYVISRYVYENNPSIKALANSSGASFNDKIRQQLEDASIIHWTARSNQTYYESFWNNNNSYFNGKWWRDTELMSIAGAMLQAEANETGGISIQSVIDMTPDKGRNEKISALQKLSNEKVTGKWNGYTASGVLYHLNRMGYKDVGHVNDVTLSASQVSNILTWYKDRPYMAQTNDFVEDWLDPVAELAIYVGYGIAMENSLNPTVTSSTTKLYRAVSQAEYDAIKNNGGKFPHYDKAMEAKWFMTSHENAQTIGNKLYSGGNFLVIEIKVPTYALDQFYYDPYIDRVGQGYVGEIDYLNEIMIGGAK